MSLVLHILRIEEIVLLFGLHGSEGHPLRAMQLAWVKFWRLNALPFNFMLLLGKVLTDHPLDLFKRKFEEIGDESNRNDRLRI